MVRINITTKEKEPLRFITQMFIETHEEDRDTYNEELLIAKKILNKLETSYD